MLKRYCLLVLVIHFLFVNIVFSKEHIDTPKENDYPYTEEAFSPCGIKQTEKELTDKNQPKVASARDITYVTGGICKDEAEFMKGIAPKFPLAILLVEKEEGKEVYLADVRVTLINSNNEAVLDVMTEGPFLLVNLPSGDYTISALFHGIPKTKAIKIRDKQHKRVVFSWDLSQ